MIPVRYAEVPPEGRMKRLIYSYADGYTTRSEEYTVHGRDQQEQKDCPNGRQVLHRKHIQKNKHHHKKNARSALHCQEDIADCLIQALLSPAPSSLGSEIATTEYDSLSDQAAALQSGEVEAIIYNEGYTGILEETIT